MSVLVGGLDESAERISCTLPTLVPPSLSVVLPTSHMSQCELTCHHVKALSCNSILSTQQSGECTYEMLQPHLACRFCVWKLRCRLVVMRGV